ncbi:PKD domain-containing protein [Kitasatospora gansuensis]
MYHRRFSATAALVAAGLVLIPGPAMAAGPATPGQSTELTPQGVDTFSSAATNSVRPQGGAAGEVGSRGVRNGKTIFASTSGSCTAETGAGTEASPYCLPQSAVDAAATGDTVKLLGSVGYFSQRPLTVRTSGISIIGVGTQAWIDARTAPALTLDGVTDVTVQNLMLGAWFSSAVRITNSSDVTLDSSYVDLGNVNGPTDSITIDGTSSNVTVSRTYVDTGYYTQGASGIAVAAGAKQVTLAGNILAATGITATGVNGLIVDGNTIQRGCAPAVTVQGGSTAVSIQNNLLEDTNPETAYKGGLKPDCLKYGQGWAPDLSVAADSAAATTADYNAFYSYGDNATAPYSWAGTGYSTLAAFRAGVPGQGAHDLVDPKKAGYVYLRPNKSNNVDARVQSGSAVIGSANVNAPGHLSSDFYGIAVQNNRGAVKYAGNPNLSVGLDAIGTSGHGIGLTGYTVSDAVPLKVDIAWGDGNTGTTTAQGGRQFDADHTYFDPGTYRITVTLTDPDGVTASNTLEVTTLGSHYTAYGPTRLLDTREGIGAPTAKVAGRSSVRVKVGGNGGIPAQASSAVLNVTVTNASSGGFITAYGSGGDRPATSNVNFTAGQTVPNLVIVPVGEDGYVELFNGGGGSVDLIADIAGYFTRSVSSGYTPVAPARLVDTREGLGTTRGQVAGRASFPVQVANSPVGQLPGGITAVALNVTTTGAGSGGFLTVYPNGTATPNASNVNFGKGQTIANSVIVPVGPDGKIRVFNGSGSPTDVIVDVVGYYSAAAAAPTSRSTRSGWWTPGPPSSGTSRSPVVATST